MLQADKRRVGVLVIDTERGLWYGGQGRRGDIPMESQSRFTELKGGGDYVGGHHVKSHWRNRYNR